MINVFIYYFDKNFKWECSFKTNECFVILFHDSQYVMNDTESKKNKITILTWLFEKKLVQQTRNTTFN